MKLLNSSVLVLLILSILFLPQEKQKSAQASEEFSLQAQTKQNKLRPTKGPSMHVLLQGIIKPSKAPKFESFFQEKIKPVLERNKDVLKVFTYNVIIGEDLRYIMLLELPSNCSISYNRALKAFAEVYTPEESLRLVYELSDFFDSYSTSIIDYRPGLSIPLKTPLKIVKPINRPTETERREK